MVDAAQATLLIAAKEQRRASVRAISVHKSDATIRIAEGDQILAHDPHADGYTVCSPQFFRQGDRQPEEPEEFAHRRARIGVRNELVVFLG